jgi:hypothetical protein
MYKKDPLSGKIITTVGDEYYDNSLLYEGVSKIYFWELDILYLTFDVFTTFFAHIIYCRFDPGVYKFC